MYNKIRKLCEVVWVCLLFSVSVGLSVSPRRLQPSERRRCASTASLVGDVPLIYY